MLENDMGLNYFGRHKSTLRRATVAGKLDFTEVPANGLLSISDLVEDDIAIAERAKLRAAEQSATPTLNQTFVTFE